MQSIAELISASTAPLQHDAVDARRRKTNRVLWLKLNFTVKAARLQTLKRQKYQHLQEEALLKARGLLKNWENGVVVLTEDLYRRAAGERDAQELMNYTPEALALRFSLRNDPQVLEAVKQLWQIEMGRDALGCIDQRGYASVFRRVAKSLDEKEFKKKQKLDRLLDEDWKRDSKGEASMSFANFFDSIFELADLWCETINASDYVDFLERLRERISQSRHGKRVFKPLSKVLAFDADSDEEEEEEEEDSDDDEPSERSKPRPVPVPVVQPRLLVAKAIRPASQPQKQPLNLLGKVTRVAMSSKALGRKPGVETIPVDVTTPQGSTSIVTTTLSEIVVPTATSALHTPQVSETSLQSTAQLGGMASRQRRASVVTTIQFLDDGFVHSISGGLGPGGSNGQQAFSSPSSIAEATATAAQRDQALRPSLAAAAAIALGRPSNRLSGQIPGVFHDDLASISESTQPPKPLDHQQSAAERKRIITVSTAKRAMLKSIVFATGWKAGALHSTPMSEESDSRIDELGSEGEANAEGAESTRHHNSLAETAMDATESQAYSGKNGGGAITASNGVAVRARTGSVFNGNGSGAFTAAFPKGVRQGFGAAARMRNGLTPLGTPPGPNGVVNGSTALGDVNGTKNAVKLNAIAQSIVTQGADAIDFSNSVLMSSYVVDRPSTSSQPYRPPKVLGPHMSARKPPLAMAIDPSKTGHEEGVLRGQRAIPKQAPQLQQPAPEINGQMEPELKKPMTVVMNKPQPLSEILQPSTGQPHRYAGHALHAQTPGHALGPIAASSNGPEGSLEQALRIKAALDQIHDYKRQGQVVHVDYERVYDHTEPGARLLSPVIATSHDSAQKTEHGMLIQAYAGGRASPADTKRKVSPLSKQRGHVVDPLASPWDTFDDDDDDDVSGGGTSSVSSARSLLQPESATEALAKVISKRAASLSAGATRRRGSTSTVKRPRSRPSSTNLYSERESTEINDGEAESGDENYTYREELTPKPARSRLLTVSSLGGNSVEGRQNDHPGVSQRLMRRGSREIEELDGLRESISAPVLMKVSPLELNTSPHRSITKTRSTTNHGNTRERRPSLVRTLPPSHDVSIDDLELRGEQAFDSPPRPLPTRATSPPKQCTCSRSHEPEPVDGDQLMTSSSPPPRYRLDLTPNYSEEGGLDGDRQAGPDGRCAVCSKMSGVDATIIVNAKRELKFEPRPKELDVIAQASQEMPRRSEMMRRRHRYTRGKHS